MTRTELSNIFLTPHGPVVTVVWDNVSVTGIGDTVIAAGEANRAIVVLGYLLVCSGAVDEVTFEASGGEILSGPYKHADSGGNIGAPAEKMLHFVVPTGEDLVLGVSTAVHVGGHIVYGFIPKTS